MSVPVFGFLEMCGGYVHTGKATLAVFVCQDTRMREMYLAGHVHGFAHLWVCYANEVSG